MREKGSLLYVDECHRVSNNLESLVLIVIFVAPFLGQTHADPTVKDSDEEEPCQLPSKRLSASANPGTPNHC